MSDSLRGSGNTVATPGNTFEIADEFVLSETDFEGLGERRQGKVRDVYTAGEQVTFVTTDRYSAFDRNLALVPFKGEIVNAVTQFWFDRTKHIIPNHVKYYPDPNVIVGERCEVIPVEVVVRGFITGSTATSLWTAYQKGQRDFGDFVLPNGMVKNQRLDRLVITPTTKFEEHDRPLTGSEVISEGLVDQATWDYMQQKAIELFIPGQEIALESGLILADTKYEFGRAADGTIKLIDEIHTPDSSRYWLAEQYLERFTAGLEPDNYDKEFLRLWFRSVCDPYHDEVVPEAPTEMVLELARRYIQVYERLTGQKFTPDLRQPINDRIRQNLGLSVIQNWGEL